MYRQSKAITLVSYDFSESHKITSFFTLHQGRIKGIAKGAKSAKRLMQSALQPFAMIDLYYFQKENRELVQVIRTEVIDYFERIRSDLEATANALYIIEILEKTTPLEDPLTDVFHLAKWALQAIDHGSEPFMVRPRFEFRLLSILGLQPLIDGCVSCLEQTKENMAGFSISQRGLVCDKCSKTVSRFIKLPAEAIAFLITIYKNEDAGVIELSKEESLALRNLFVKLLADEFDIRLHSLDFLIQVE